MSKTFKRFLLEEIAKDGELATVNKSIGYMEDLPIDDLIYSVKNLKDFIVTEKLDGTALTIGFDNDGKFYTTRRGKGSDKLIYNSEDYGVNAAANVFKSAHEALKANEKALSPLVSNGTAFDIEILYGAQPNAITYNASGANHIVFLKATIGTDPTKPLDHSRVPELGKALADKSTTVSVDGVDTVDGTELSELSISTTWKFAASKFISGTEVDNSAVQNEILAVEKYLSQRNDIASSYTGKVATNKEVLQLSTTGISVEGKERIKTEKTKIQDVIKNDYVLDIKDILLEKFISKFSGSMHDGALEQADAVELEGLVFLNTTNGTQFKLVDTEVFKQINKFNYKVRLTIKGKILTDNPDAPLESRGGIYGAAYIRIVNLLNIPGIARPGAVKKTLAPLVGKTVQDTINNIAQSANNSPNHNSIKTKIIAVLDTTDGNIVKALVVFKDEHDAYELKLNNGKVVKYTEEIVKRTLLTFAETRKTIAKLRSDIAKTSSLQDIISVLLGEQIKSIHGTVQ